MASYPPETTRRRFLLETGALTLAAAVPLRAQSPRDLARSTWNGRWISAPGAPPTGYGVYYFRRAFDLPAKPESFVVHASGDNRYQLFANGRRVAWGPARGDLFHWRYETVDLAPYLEAGRNVLAAVVWNFGEIAPEAQVTYETGFLLEGDTEAERVASTGPSWKCVRDEAYSPEVGGNIHAYFVVGPGDRVNGAAHPWGWETRDFDDSRWPSAVALAPAAGREARDVHTRWMLVPRAIPAEEERPERLQRVRRAEGIPAPAAFPAKAERVEIRARTHAVLLLDQTYLTTAYPELTVSGGKDAVVRIGYAEALFQPATNGRGMEKGNRNEVEGKRFIGYHDEFVADGGAARTFRPLWWRTYRYIELDVQTKDAPLTIDDLEATYTGYPFVRRARFEGGQPEIGRILDTGWRTARLCSHETYMDCPYYEQLQYVGDTRIQCLISLFNSGDARLMRNAIELIDNSREGESCTMSRYPTRLEQYIPGFSLWWIGMVHDYWWYVDDPAFVRSMLPGVRSVLSFFEKYQKPNGSLGALPWWRFFDWVPQWPNGDAPGEPDGGSALFDMLLLLGYRWAADMETALGISTMANVYRGRERTLRETVQSLYWDPGRRLYADTPRKQQFSQHANTLAVLGDVITGNPARDLMVRILTEPGLARTQLYFRYYLHVALAKVGEGERYLDQMGDWRDMLAQGLTTFAEWADRPGASPRSDCHAWSASPNIEIFRTVLGVDSAAPAFGRVSVRPHPGSLKSVSGAVPHPRGMIEVAIDPQSATVTLPPGVTGEFEFRGVRRELPSGSTHIPAPANG
jgi:alpha-L-rhamnosidase